MTIRPANPHERKAHFAYLKHASSLAAWTLVCEYHRRFVDVVRPAYQETQRNPPAGGPLIFTNEMSLLLQCQATFDAGVARLRSGDRSCFKWLGAPGHFSEAMRLSDAWDAGYHRHVIGVVDVPTWPQIEYAWRACQRVHGEYEEVLELRYTDMAARLADPDIFNNLPTIAYYLSLDTLPPVPDPQPPCFIRTGDPVPYYGIWEPVDLQVTDGFLGLFRKPVLPADGSIPPDGCMNYLHQGSPAPTIHFDGDSYRGEGRPTTWRLLWADDRYGHNPIPECEAHYFVPKLSFHVASGTVTT